MLLEVEGLQVNYGKIVALRGIDLAVAQGEIVTLIGANGAGKTTTLKTISGLRSVAAGRVVLDGRDITGMPGHKRVQAGLCQAPEGRGVFPGMTVTENLAMGAYIHGRPDQTDLERVFNLFPRLAERRNQHGGTLSGGEQQMLAIGRGLMAQPKVLLLDEPSMGLAPILVEEIFSIIKEINAQGVAILLVEQNALMALSVANRGYVLETGRIVLEGSGQALLQDPQVMKAYLGGH